MPPSRLQQFPDFGGGITLGRNAGKYPQHQYTYIDYASIEAGLPIRIEFAGRDEAVKGCFRHIRRRDMLSIETVTEGDAVFCQDGHTFHVQEGEFFIFQPLSESILAIGPAGHCTKLVVGMTGSLLDETLSRLAIRRLHHIRPDPSAGLRQRMAEIWQLVKDPDRDLARLCGAGYELLVTLSRQAERMGTPAPLSRALAVIEEHLHTSLRLDELAHECGQSNSSLWRLFREHFDCGPITYYIDRKMRFAQHLLRHGGALSIKEIAYGLGYRDPLYFSAEFKKHTGCSPSDYRMRNVPGPTL